MLIDLEFQIGDIVYLQTDEDQKRRMITGIYLTQNEVIYYLTCGTDETKHYDFELSYNKLLTIN